MGLQAKRSSTIESPLHTPSLNRHLSHFSVFLDSLCGQAALLDPAGEILLVNQEWRDFGDGNGLRDSNTDHLTCAVL